MSKLNNKINKSHERIKIENKLNPLNLNMLFDITKDSYSVGLDNTFIVFKTINNILYLIYSTKNKSIKTYNLINNEIISEIKNAHNYFITNFRYYSDKINKRDLILSISAGDYNIKIWDINNFECLLNIKNINKNGYIHSACFLNDNNKIYIITSNYNSDNNEFIKIYDLKGNKVKEINNFNDNTSFIEIYYDDKLSKNYIITSNRVYIKSYDYEQNKIYHRYFDNNDISLHSSIVINNKEEIVELIVLYSDGNIKIWNFHSEQLLNKIQVNNNLLYDICLWNNEYLFVACSDNTIKIIDLNKRIIIKELREYKTNVKTIKKIIHPKYGECLISQGYDDIKLWVNKK